MIPEIDSRSFKLLLDSFHMNIGEANIGDAIRGAGEALGYFELVDSNRRAPGQGHTDFDEILAALADIRGRVSATRQTADFFRVGAGSRYGIGGPNRGARDR